MFEHYYNVKVSVYLYSYYLDIETSYEVGNYMVNLIKVKIFDYPIYIWKMQIIINIIMVCLVVITSICNNFCNILVNNGCYAGVYAPQSLFDAKLNITKYDKRISSRGINDGTVQKDLSNICGMYQYISKKQILDRHFDGDIAYKDYFKIMKKMIAGQIHLDIIVFILGDIVCINTPY